MGSCQQLSGKTGDFQPTAIEKDDQTWDLGALYQHLMVEIHQFSTGVSILLWDNDTPAWMAIKFHHFPIHFPYELVIFHNVLHDFPAFFGKYEIIFPAFGFL